MNRIKVAAAVIVKTQKVLLASRPQGKHLAGLWEFPGGKIEAGEKLHDALKRELLEELGMEIVPCDIIGHCCFEYSEKAVEIFFTRCLYHGANSTITANEDQSFKFVPATELKYIEFVPADRDFAVFLEKFLGFIQ